MSLTYRARRNRKTFYANVYSATFLGRAHKLLGLPICPGSERTRNFCRVPYDATARQCREWAKTLFEALEIFAGLGSGLAAESADAHNDTKFLFKWAQFLATCSGYRGD